MIKAILVGLDIGITTGLAIYDFDRNLIYAGSKRNISIDNLIRDISLYGKPLIVATDKKKTPNPVSKIAASFNCIVFSPDHDLTIEEKEEIVRIPIKDDHERDALSAATFALKSYAAQFNNIDRSLESIGMADLRDKVKELILNKQAKNISDAIEKLKPRKEEPKRETVYKEVNLDWKVKVEELEIELRDERRRNTILKDYCEKLEDKNRELEMQKQAFIEEEMRKNEDARKNVLRDKEVKKRDIMINQLHFELAKMKNINGAVEEKTDINEELSQIENEDKVPVVIIPEFTREAISRSNRKFKLEDKIIWVKKFIPSNASANFLISLGPKIVIGDIRGATREILAKAGIMVIDTIMPEKRKFFAAVSAEEIDNELKKSRKNDFMNWLDQYKTRKK